jgi:hypothetical protein
MARRTTKRKNSDSTLPVEETQGNTVTEPVQPEEPQEEVGGGDDIEAENAFEADSTPATPVDSAHTTPSPAPRRQQDDDEFDLDYEEGSDEFPIRYERPRERSLSEDVAEADAYFKQYVTSTFHPDDHTVDNRIHVIYPLVTQPPTAITAQTVPNLSVQERQSATKVRDHRRALHKARFWPLYVMLYHRATKASQTETAFRANLTRDDTMKLGFHEVNTYAYERRIWPTQLGGQLWGTRDAFLPTNPLSFDNKFRTSLDVTRHSRPSSSYNRVCDPTESALRALPFGTWPVPGEFYRDYIAAWLGPLLEFTLSHQRCVNAWIIAQYGLTRQEVEGVPELDWLQTLLSRGCPLDVFAYIVEHESIDKLLHLVKRRPASGRIGQMERKRSWQGVERTPRLQLAPGWTNGHPRELRETRRADEKESSHFPRVVGVT